MHKNSWKELLLEAAQIDFQEPLPELDEHFLDVWAVHYAAIADLTLPDVDILEIGTGYAVLAAGLGRMSQSRVLGLEHPSRAYFFSFEYLQFLRHSRVDLFGADLRYGLPLSSKSMNQIYCCDVLEHLQPQTALQLLHEVSRVLRPGGELVVSTPNLNRFSNIMRLMRGHTVNPPIESSRYGQTNGHIREFSPAEIKIFLQRAGLTLVRCSFASNPYFTAQAFGQDNIWSQRQTRWINRITRIASQAFPRLGDEIYILARKECNDQRYEGQ